MEPEGSLAYSQMTITCSVCLSVCLLHIIWFRYQHKRKASCIIIYVCDTYWLTYLFTYSLDGAESFWRELSGFQLVKNFPTFYGTRRFFSTFTNDHQLSLSWASSIQSIFTHASSWRSIVILSSHLCLGFPTCLFPFRFPHQNPEHNSPLPHMCYMSSPSHSSRFYHRTILGEVYKYFSSSLCNLLHFPVTSSP